MLADFGAQLGKRVKQRVGAGAVGELGAQAVEQIAKGLLGIGAAHGAVGFAVEIGGEAEAQLPVVGKQPVAAPHFALERVGVFQRVDALRGFADVGDDVF